MGVEKDLFGGPNQAACLVCNTIHKTPEKARECRERHEIEDRREKARRYARTGVSQFKKPEGAKP